MRHVRERVGESPLGRGAECRYDGMGDRRAGGNWESSAQRLSGSRWGMTFYDRRGGWGSVKQWRQRIVFCIVELGHGLSRDACDLAGIIFVYVLLDVCVCWPF